MRATAVLLASVLCVCAPAFAQDWALYTNNEDGFKVERSLDGRSYTQIATVGRNVKAYSSTGLSAAKKYYYRVRAYHSGGDSAYTTAVSATTSK